ncbi:MAG: Lrp/AsnC family transcriptional regulator [Christensenellales bacterium]|jgi:DNA-binding Lrp family transcriptional regulator|nr:Lrp/AsnC family transcriptional regulator [Clostridiales bacterium]
MTKELSKEILEILRQDCRVDAEQIAVMINADPAEVAEEIKRLERDRVIVKYNAVVNMEKFDKDMVQALIEVRVTPQREQGFDALAKRIYRFAEVRSVYLVSGSYDLMVLVEGLDMRQVALFVAEKLSVIDGVLSTATSFVLRKYKEDGVIILDDEKDDRLVVTA